jgi:hypothetical protein
MLLTSDPTRNNLIHPNKHSLWPEQSTQFYLYVSFSHVYYAQARAGSVFRIDTFRVRRMSGRRAARLATSATGFGSSGRRLLVGRFTLLLDPGVSGGPVPVLEVGAIKSVETMSARRAACEVARLTLLLTRRYRSRKHTRRP